MEEESKYSKFHERTITTHMFASRYGWNYKDIYGEEEGDLPYPIRQELLELLAIIEEDLLALSGAADVANYKALRRRYEKKTDEPEKEESEVERLLRHNANRNIN